MGVFPLAAGLELFRTAALAAAEELGVFSALPCDSLEALADAIGVLEGRHRVRALVDALVAAGVIVRDGARLDVFEVPPIRDVPSAGWGRLAHVIRQDRPEPLLADPSAYQAHLVAAGAATARSVAWDGESLLDLGGGAGTYTAAFLDARPGTTATLVDAPEVIELARANLARFGDRVRLVAGDARNVEVPRHETVLLANVLHLHGPEVCAELVSSAARASTQRVIVVDFDGASPEGTWFALNMALYTERGDVHATTAIRSWLAAAGAGRIDEARSAADPEMLILTGRGDLALRR